MRHSELISKALSGDRQALAKAASLLEAGPPPDVLDQLYAAPTASKTVGITGPPGSGKSSLISALAAEMLSQGRTVAVVAVDPSSPVSGGATLGDRIRLSRIPQPDPRLFVRSLASRGRTDGLSPVVAPMLHLFAASGFDYVILETVGAGQDQYEVARLVDTTLLVEAPGGGDTVQMLKAGVMELADIFVVSKGDLDGAQWLAKEMRSTLSTGHLDEGAWRQPVVVTAAESGTGIAELIRLIHEHDDVQHSATSVADRDRSRATSEISRELAELTAFDGVREPDSHRNQLVEEVAQGRMSPREAALHVLDEVIHEQRSQLKDCEPEPPDLQ